MKISVIITTHNRSTLLRDAIESVVVQEPCGADVEVIVIDDASTDNTPEVVDSYPGVIYLRTQQGTASGSRNVGLSLATGEWIAFLDDDDAWLPEKIKTCYDLILEHPEARFVYTSAYICDAALEHSNVIWFGPDLSRYQSIPEAFLDEVITPSMMVIHCEVFEAIGLFDVSIPRAEDRDLLCRAAIHGFRCASTTEPLVLYRVREMPDGDMIYQTYLTTRTVLSRYMKEIIPGRFSWRRRLGIQRHISGQYVFELINASKLARKTKDRKGAARFRHFAFTISPLHFLKQTLLFWR